MCVLFVFVCSVLGFGGFLLIKIFPVVCVRACMRVFNDILALKKN